MPGVAFPLALLLWCADARASPNKGGEGKDWTLNASAATVDLSNPRLRTLAAGLAGATWRIGGTHCDSVTYVVGNTSAAAACKAGGWT